MTARTNVLCVATAAFVLACALPAGAEMIVLACDDRTGDNPDECLGLMNRQQAVAAEHTATEIVPPPA
ncbi:MAG: hypothetical protein GC150_12870 [Rhizobiales bacterium]|nr:hypothetical protein [Hyphomicrobiales bacterium]